MGAPLASACEHMCMHGGIGRRAEAKSGIAVPAIHYVLFKREQVTNNSDFNTLAPRAAPTHLPHTRPGSRLDVVPGGSTESGSAAPAAPSRAAFSARSAAAAARAAAAAASRSVGAPQTAQQRARAGVVAAALPPVQMQPGLAWLCRH